MIDSLCLFTRKISVAFVYYSLFTCRYFSYARLIRSIYKVRGVFFFSNKISMRFQWQFYFDDIDPARDYNTKTVTFWKKKKVTVKLLIIVRITKV